MCIFSKIYWLIFPNAIFWNEWIILWPTIAYTAAGMFRNIQRHARTKRTFYLFLERAIGFFKKNLYFLIQCWWSIPVKHTIKVVKVAWATLHLYPLFTLLAFSWRTSLSTSQLVTTKLISHLIIKYLNTDSKDGFH